MKKNVVLTAGLIGITLLSYGQWTTSSPFYLNAPARIGATGTASNKLEVVTGTAGDGIKISQTGTGATGLHFAPATGDLWSIYTLGSSDGWGGAGDFAIQNPVRDPFSPYFYIKGNTGNVGIGSTSPAAKLHVVGTTYAIRGTATHASVAYGVHGIANGAGSGVAYGVVGTGSNGTHSFGGLFTGIGGVGTAIGVYAAVTNAQPLDYAGYFNGDVYCTGTYYGSDRKLKDNIRPLANALDKINLLKPSIYTFRTGEFKDLALPQGEQIGLIAQEVESVFPELIKGVAAMSTKDENGAVISNIPDYKSVNYIGLIPVLIAGMQEQQKQIEKQNELIAQLSKTGATTGLNASSEPVNGFALEQNIPNPFTSETVIKYTLPQQVNAASLLVYDLSGKQIASFPITEKGSSSITLTSEKLAAGIYIYSVMADGKLMDSKRMVVAQK